MHGYAGLDSSEEAEADKLYADIEKEKKMCLIMFHISNGIRSFTRRR